MCVRARWADRRLWAVRKKHDEKSVHCPLFLGPIVMALKRACGQDDDEDPYTPDEKRITPERVVERMLHRRYTIGDRIGRGTAGSVYRIVGDLFASPIGRAPTRSLVVKVVLPPPHATAGQRSSTDEEVIAEMAAFNRVGVRHPGVVSFVESYHLAGEGGYIVMEECVGGTLDALIRATRERNQHFSLCRVRKYARQLFSALAFFQEQRLIHRDIKPENLLIDGDSNLRIADFGLVHLFSGDEGDGTPFENVVTTLWFRPPEVLLPGMLPEITDAFAYADRLTHSCSLDIWSAGCVVGEMAACRPLFAADTEIDLLCRITRELGTPADAEWPEAALYLDEIRRADVCAPPTRMPWSAHAFSVQGGELARDLLAHTVAYVPRMRLCASAVLDHPFFHMDTKGVLVSA